MLNEDFRPKYMQQSRHDDGRMTREEAIQVLNMVEAYGLADEAKRMAIEALKDRPKGEWIKNDDFTCSECGYHMVVGDGAYNFCPNCGADMRGGNNG